MSRLRITVLKRFKPEEVFREPPVKATYSGPCPVFKDDQVVNVEEGLKMPEGFCPYAWDAIFPYAVTLASKGDFLDWYEEPAVCIGCCP
ncbi:TIGR04076 family protein, partial [bacterium]